MFNLLVGILWIVAGASAFFAPWLLPFLVPAVWISLAVMLLRPRL